MHHKSLYKALHTYVRQLHNTLQNDSSTDSTHSTTEGTTGCFYNGAWTPRCFEEKEKGAAVFLSPTLSVNPWVWCGTTCILLIHKCQSRYKVWSHNKDGDHSWTCLFYSYSDGATTQHCGRREWFHLSLPSTLQLTVEYMVHVWDICAACRLLQLAWLTVPVLCFAWLTVFCVLRLCYSQLHSDDSHEWTNE